MMKKLPPLRRFYRDLMFANEVFIGQAYAVSDLTHKANRYYESGTW
jgi:hypothetical protein